MKKLVLLSIWAMSVLVGVAQAQSVNATRVGKGLQFIAADSSFAVKLSARFQSLYVGEHDLVGDNYSDRFLIRRARLKFEGYTFSPDLTYKVELGLSNGDIGGSVQREFNNTANVVLDAYVRWEFAPNLSLLFGQAKLPGNRERVISSQKLQFVDRSLLNSAYNIDRDTGLQLFHTFSVGGVVFREVAAFTTGEGRNFSVANRGGYDYTGRVEVLPFGEFVSDGDYFGADLVREKTPKLAFGATYDYNEGASRQGGQLGTFFASERTLKAFFVDAMFKYQGFSFMGEYANKEAAGSPIVVVDDTGAVTQSFQAGDGLNLQAGYVFPNNVELAARYTYIHPDELTQRETHRQYTLGISKYVAGHTVKVQSDVSLLREFSQNQELMYRFQVEMGF